MSVWRQHAHQSPTPLQTRNSRKEKMGVLDLTNGDLCKKWRVLESGRAAFSLCRLACGKEIFIAEDMRTRLCQHGFAAFTTMSFFGAPLAPFDAPTDQRQPDPTRLCQCCPRTHTRHLWQWQSRRALPTATARKNLTVPLVLPR